MFTQVGDLEVTYLGNQDREEDLNRKKILILKMKEIREHNQGEVEEEHIQDIKNSTLEKS